MDVVTIAAVSVGNYCGMGARYVNALFRGCARNLTIPFRFVCFTDDDRGLEPAIGVRSVPPRLDGWYNKLALFRPDAFEVGERVLYIDLDTIVLGNIDDIARYDGPFAMLANAYVPGVPCQSGIMAWEAGRHANIWDEWSASGFPTVPGGDQEWIQHRVSGAVTLQSFFPGRLLSFKYECAKLASPRNRRDAELKALWARYVRVPYPSGASIVYFHGQPKPHNCRSRWVGDAWEPAGQEKAGRYVRRASDLMSRLP